MTTTDLIHTGHEQCPSEGRGGAHEDVGDGGRVL